jgi:aspartate kinase
MFDVLASAGINVEMINTSELQVNVVIASARAEEALRCLRQKFADSLDCPNESAAKQKTTLS